MNFVSIDFETANPSRVSICAAGMAVFENGILTESPYWLVRPPKGHGWFLENFIGCHGLTHLDVLDAPEFPAIASEFLARLGRADLVIAHNAEFDIDHLRKTLDYFSLPCPAFDYLCTCKLSRRIWPELASHSLDALTAYIGHDFNHHHAQSDAEAAGRVLLAMMKHAGVKTPHELLEMAGIGSKRFCHKELSCDENSRDASVIQLIPKEPTHLESQASATQRAGSPLSDERRSSEEFILGDVSLLLHRISTSAQKYEENLALQKRNEDVGFNLFELISDHYYRETFHSDILKGFLDPKGNHQQGKKYLWHFLQFVNKHAGPTIDLSKYENAEVEKEEGRMDILIKGFGHAIILENKINGAPDQPQQLPRYLKKVEDRDYVCDAIIYLRLNGYGNPDMASWTPGQIRQVEPILKVVCAYDETEKDLLKGWILECEADSNGNPDAKVILRQYGRIIKKLGANIMNKPVMKDLFDILVMNGNFKTALSFKKMLGELAEYGAQRIVDKFESEYDPSKCEHDLFQKPSPYKNGVIFPLRFGQATLHMAVWLEPKSDQVPESYLFTFHDKNDQTGTNRRAEAILGEMKCLDHYISENGTFKKTFAFPYDEKHLFEHISTFKKEAQRAIESMTLEPLG